MGPFLNILDGWLSRKFFRIVLIARAERHPWRVANDADILPRVVAVVRTKE